MKKLILVLGLATIMISCNKYDKAKDFLKNKKNVSELELKGFEFKDYEISDKEYLDKMSDYYTKLSEEEKVLSTEAAIKDIDESRKYIDSAGKSKGDKKYKMTTYYKMLEKDTVRLGYLYFNESDKLINADCVR